MIFFGWKGAFETMGVFSDCPLGTKELRVFRFTTFFLLDRPHPDYGLWESWDYDQAWPSTRLCWSNDSPFDAGWLMVGWCEKPDLSWEILFNPIFFTEKTSTQKKRLIEHRNSLMVWTEVVLQLIMMFDSRCWMKLDGYLFVQFCLVSTVVDVVASGPGDRFLLCKSGVWHPSVQSWTDCISLWFVEWLSQNTWNGGYP